MAASRKTNQNTKNPVMDEFVKLLQQAPAIPFSQVKPGLDKILDADPDLIHKKTNTFQRGKYMSPLEMVMKYVPSPEFVMYLIEHGADVNEPFSDGSPPLLTLMYKGHPDIIKYLISSGADVNRTDKNGITALMYARSLEIARLLVENGANLDLQDNWGRTALMYAVSENRLRIVEYLISVGAETQLLNKSGKTLQNFALNGYSRQAVKQMLPQEGGRVRKLRSTKKHRRVKKQGKKQDKTRRH